MKVRELISALTKLDMDADVFHLYDGELRAEIECCYIGKSGHCVTADHDAVCYSDDGRPISAPSKDECKYWRTQGLGLDGAQALALLDADRSLARTPGMGKPKNELESTQVEGEWEK